MAIHSKHRGILAGVFALVVVIGIIVWLGSGMQDDKTPVSVDGSWRTGIRGTVMLGPLCPVVKNPPDPACADKPHATALALVSGDGARVIKEFRSDADGAFFVETAAGEYAIRSADGAANLLPYCASGATILVREGETVLADVSCDTGIR